MPNLIDLRRRIKSVKNTQQITKAMKTVSTAKFRKAQRNVLEGRPLWHDSPEVRLILIGKKASNFFRKQPFPIEKAYADKTDRLGDADFADLAERLGREFTYQDTDAVYVIYNEFKSILAPRIMTVRLLPVARAASVPGPEPSVPDWEPAAPALLASLIPRYIEDQLRHVFGESQAAEQAARMMAMENASKNAGELIENLVLGLNKVRQASITKELLEIISAVEAMKE
jgi:F-type H+-transporting ATPase subunit gamma